ncbi:hypothetical protein [Sphingomonas sp. NPDC079357]|uniref:hypothetical protein n=1 Tax=Sphingomonas sp. NPDC079357 TaxID=3364518 RepID=UPI00384FA5E3
MQNLFPRLLGAIGVHAVLGAILWALTRYVLIVQSGLSSDLLTRTDGDPARIEVYLRDIEGDVLTAGAGAMVVSAVLAIVWLVLVHRYPPYGDQSARSRRNGWAALLLLALATTAGLFWWKVIEGATAALLAPGLGTKVALVATGLVLLAYWLSTAWFSPAASRIAVPGAQLISR